MMRFAANIDWMFNEHPFLDRFQAARDCGFAGVEILFAYDHKIDDLARARERAGIEVSIINAPAGDRAAGDVGCAAMPGREDRFARELRLAAEYAQALGAKRVHLLCGNHVAGVPFADMVATYRRNIALAAQVLGAVGCTATLEPLNSRDRPWYFMSHLDQAVAEITAQARSFLRLQFDTYHVALMDGEVVGHFQRVRPLVDYIQVSSLDGRGPPAPGGIDFPAFFAAVKASGYSGWIGCEYKPPGPTRASLGWGREFGLG